MKPTLRSVLSLMTLCLFFKGPAILAQTTGSAETAETVRLNFKVVSLDKSIESLHYDNGREWTALKVPTGYPAGGFEYVGAPELDFYETIPVPDEEGRLPPADLSVPLPKDTSEALVLIFAAERDGQMLYRGTAIDFSLEAFPGGGVLLYNLTRQDLDGRVGKTRLEMSSNQTRFLKQLDPDEADGQCSVVLGFREDADTWKRAVSTVWWADERFRTIRLIIPDDDRSGAIRFRTIYERTP
jgi:hypothetical protein